MSEVHLSAPSKTPAQSAKIRSADVVVVGGGITGKACALGLAQLGLNTIEIAPDLGQTVSTPQGLQWGQRIYAFSPSTQKLLAHLQI
jgi:2-polyprenyl-6-methoxyphenol hydroxylase-like FAD-dependent oxidoreductase